MPHTNMPLFHQYSPAATYSSAVARSGFSRKPEANNGSNPHRPALSHLTEITVSRGRIGWWYAQRVQDRLGSRRRCSRVDDSCELLAGSDTMVGGQHHHHHISEALSADQCSQADGCRGVATHGLADDVGVRQIRKLFSNERNEGFVREHEIRSEGAIREARR